MSHELSRIHLAEPLRCGMMGCAEPTTSGLLGPDPQTRGLWRLLPVCSRCSTTLRGHYAERRARQRKPRA